MCADTRLSRIIEKEGKEYFERIHDSQLKLVPIKNYNIAVGCVGSPTMGTFLINRITKLLNAEVDIRKLRYLLNQKEDGIKMWINDYLVGPPPVQYKNARCVLLFAGQNPHKKRKVEGKKLLDIIRSYEESSQKEFDSLFDGKPIEQLSQAELGRLHYEVAKRQTGIKDILFKGMKQLQKSSKEIEVSVPDQFIFALKINCAHPDDIVSFDDFEWGGLAVYGANYNSDILPKTFFGDLDLNMRAGKVETDIIPFVCEIREKFSDIIGGSITNLILKDGLIFSIANQIRRKKTLKGESEVIYHTTFINHELHHFYSGVWSRLIPFTEHQKLLSNQASLIE